MRRSAWGVVLVVAGLAGACTGGGGDDATTTTVEQETTTTVENTTTTVAPDPFAVPADPADIDEAYVEAVLTELEHINGDALRLAVSEGLSPAVRELLESIYEPELLASQLQGLVDASGAGFPGILRPPGDVIADVTSVNVATATCISVDATLNFARVSETGTAQGARIELRPSTGGGPSNDTPWLYVLRDPMPSTSGLPQECEAA